MFKEYLEKLKWQHIALVVLFLAVLFLIYTNTDLLKGSVCTLPPSVQEQVRQTESFEPGSKGKSSCVLYYAMWCGYSRSFLPEWEKFEKYAASSLPNIETKRVRCEDGLEAECNQKGVRGYPTIIMYRADGSEIPFDDDRTVEALVNFCKKNT